MRPEDLINPACRSSLLWRAGLPPYGNARHLGALQGNSRRQAPTFEVLPPDYAFRVSPRAFGLRMPDLSPQRCVATTRCAKGSISLPQISRATLESPASPSWSLD